MQKRNPPTSAHKAVSKQNRFSRHRLQPSRSLLQDSTARRRKLQPCKANSRSCARATESSKHKPRRRKRTCKRRTYATLIPRIGSRSRMNSIRRRFSWLEGVPQQHRISQSKAIRPFVPASSRFYSSRRKWRSLRLDVAITTRPLWMPLPLFVS